MKNDKWTKYIKSKGDDASQRMDNLGNKVTDISNESIDHVTQRIVLLHLVITWNLICHYIRWLYGFIAAICLGTMSRICYMNAYIDAIQPITTIIMKIQCYAIILLPLFSIFFRV